ncbi:Lysyl-tRNA synthetase [Mycoplasma haemocanis str. Illinois]|uniref:Lysine--tRNA ligase n=1 Tax=Mycoplasma haemocanis (strain Illinois) TaxID=1111676 RepID=H6N5H5_MYCHN|nr:lysine--tRNA ligase [Mycoplasma haemocanis]AEW44935.1 Lysyl-tRNA synthetase [Mycoplasma haemocanis str. Illinois]
MSFEEIHEQEQSRRKNLDSLKENPFSIEKVSASHEIASVVKDYSGLLEKNESISLIGRLVSIREPFATLREEWNDMQIYFRKGDLGSLDVGDFIFVEGTLFKTKLGILTLRAKSHKVISKCLNSFPSQYYGIKDKEIQLRNRVVHCLVDQDVFNTFKRRAQIIRSIRNFLDGKGYLEFETPILESNYGGANAVPFRTYYKALKSDFFLRIATEISLKKIIISGFSKIYEIGRVFRNEGIDSTHNPEFTSLEIYTVNCGLDGVMDLTESLFKHVAEELKLDSVVWNERNISFKRPFRRVSIAELLKEKIDVDFYNDDISLERALALAKAQAVHLEKHQETVGHIFHLLFEKLVEKDLVEPTFVTGFHKDVSPLSKSDPKNSNFTLRYELYIGGKEFSNGFAELNDPDDQLERFKKQVEERDLGNEEAFDVDYEYIESMKYGLPPTGGIGIGIDRLVMLFTEKKSIKDVIFFPQLKK